jgi:hypothetical protein
VFFAPDASVVEIIGDAPEAVVTEVRAKGGIPVVIRGGTTSFVQTLLAPAPIRMTWRPRPGAPSTPASSSTRPAATSPRSCAGR